MTIHLATIDALESWELSDIKKIEALGEWYKQKESPKSRYTNAHRIWMTGPQVTMKNVLNGLSDVVVSSIFDALANTVIGSHGEWVRDRNYPKRVALIATAFRFGLKPQDLLSEYNFGERSAEVTQEVMEL